MVQMSKVGIIRPRVNHSAKLRLFCFPYAGGGSSIFHRWPEQLPSAVEVCSIQLPGRESRIRTPSFRMMGPLIEAVTRSISPYLDKPFALFGHSLGALVAFELARKLETFHGPRPAAFFASAADAPNTRRSVPILHGLPDDELMKKLLALYGTPHEVIQHAEVVQLLLPAIRADLHVFETYTYEPGLPIRCPIWAFGGTQDEQVRSWALEGWRKETTAAFSLTMFTGDHFFLLSARSQLLKVLRANLDSMLQSIPQIDMHRPEHIG